MKSVIRDKLRFWTVCKCRDVGSNEEPRLRTVYIRIPAAWHNEQCRYDRDNLWIALLEQHGELEIFELNDYGLAAQID